MYYSECPPDVRAIADKIIKDHRPDLANLNIQYIFRPEASISNTKVIAGRCIRVDDRNWLLHQFDVLIELAQDIWGQANDEFKVALVDHELGHIGIVRDKDGEVAFDEGSGRVKIRMNHHDIEEFEDVLQRHGAYHKDLREFLRAYELSKLAKKSSKSSNDDDDDDPDC